MKITRRQLRRIIKEELSRSLLREQESRLAKAHAQNMDKLYRLLKGAEKDWMTSAGTPQGLVDMWNDLKNIYKLVNVYQGLDDERKERKRAGLADAIARHVMDMKVSLMTEPAQLLNKIKGMFGMSLERGFGPKADDVVDAITWLVDSPIEEAAAGEIAETLLDKIA